MKTEMKNDRKERQANPGNVEYLAKRVRQIFSDAVKGKYDHRRCANEPGTGRPWVQTKQLKVDGLLGWSAIDAFDDQNIEFAEITEETVRIAHGLKHGIFATTVPLSGEELRAEYLTNHVTGMVSLDRLKADLAEKFDLSLFFIWEGESINMKVLPNCRSIQIMPAAIAAGENCVVCRLGTENDLRKVAQYGFKLNEKNTRFLRRPSKEYISYLEECGQKFLKEYLAATFDRGIVWGWSNALRADSNQALETTPMFQSKESPLLFAPSELGLPDPEPETAVPVSMNETEAAKTGELVLV